MLLNNKTIGCIFIVAGTTLGAGMLALPMVSAAAGFLPSVIALVCLWGLMVYTALLTMEVNIHFPHGASFGSMAGNLLGKKGKIVAFVSMLLLFYALVAAYISGGASLLASMVSIISQRRVPLSLTAVGFTFILGVVVYWKTKAVDYVNRLLFIIKITALIFSMSALLTHVRINLLASLSHHPVYIWAATPVMFTSFGFHGSIPSILKYQGHNAKRLVATFLIGSLIPLFIYIVWLCVTLGVLPLIGKHSFYVIQTHDHGSVAALTQSLSDHFRAPMIRAMITLFSNIAVTTSFLGVSLGLFDYFSDNLKSMPAYKKETAAFLTFLPPLGFAIFYPRGFIFALGFAAIALAVLAVILPVTMVWRWRKKNNFEIKFKTPGNNLVLGFIFIFGLVVIGLQLGVMLNWLPVYF